MWPRIRVIFCITLLTAKLNSLQFSLFTNQTNLNQQCPGPDSEKQIGSSDSEWVNSEENQSLLTASSSSASFCCGCG